MSQKQGISRFSEESQKLFDDMNQTDLRTLREIVILQNINVLIAMSSSEIDLIRYSYGWNLNYLWSPTIFQNTNYDFTSIPDFVIEKNFSRGPKYDASERQIMFYKTNLILKKARPVKTWQPSDKSFQGWYARKGYRESLTEYIYWRKRSYAFRSYRSWQTWLYSYTSWTIAERQSLNCSSEYWSIPRASSTAIRICRYVQKRHENTRCSTDRNVIISLIDTSRTWTTWTRRSAIWRRRKLRFKCRT